MARRDWDAYPDEDQGYEPYEDDYGYAEDDYGYADAYGDGYGLPGYADGYAGDDAYDDDRIYGIRDALRYAGDHNWSLALLLILLPPLGIALLWWRRRFRRRGRILVTVLALLWLALLAFLFVVRPILARRAPVEDVPVEVPVEEEDRGQTNPVVVPDDQLLTGTNVYVSENSPFYHQLAECFAFPPSDATSAEDLTIARNKGLMACPYCLGADYSDSLFDLKLVTTATRDQSGTVVYCSAGSESFHVDPNCSKLGSGLKVGLLDAVLMAKTSCEVCCPEASRQVFCTVDGRYYHYEEECSGMRGASLVKLPEALVLGKEPCPVCIKDASSVTLNTSDSNSEASTYYVYATPNGTFYHIDATCSGMKNAVQVPLKQMLAARRPACPVCCPNAETRVYGERGNPYYHSSYSCTNITNPSMGTLAEALANGLTKCPVCWVNAADIPAETAEATTEAQSP